MVSKVAAPLRQSVPTIFWLVFQRVRHEHGVVRIYRLNKTATCSRLSVSRALFTPAFVLDKER